MHISKLCPYFAPAFGKETDWIARLERFLKSFLKKVCQKFGRLKKTLYLCTTFASKIAGWWCETKFESTERCKPRKYKSSLRILSSKVFIFSRKREFQSNTFEIRAKIYSKLFFYNGEFDPGSGWTLAAGLTHASRGAA